MAKIQVTQCDLCDRASRLLKGQLWVDGEGRPLAVCEKCVRIITAAEVLGILEVSHNKRQCKEWEIVTL